MHTEITRLNPKEQLIVDLHTINAIKFGEYKLKSGIISPYYLDLRLLVSYPYLLEQVAEVFWEVLRVLYFDIVVGVPYAGIPIATAIGLKHNQSMAFVRKEVKQYGTKKHVEGEYHAGQKAVVVDDVITNGESKLETIKPLEDEGLTVEDVVVLVDRGQGGPQLLAKRGYRCHVLYGMDEIFNILLRYKRVPKDAIGKSKAFMKRTKKHFLKQTTDKK